VVPNGTQKFREVPTRRDHRINLSKSVQDELTGDAVEVPTNMDALVWLRKHLDEDGSDLLREMLRTFARRLWRPRPTPSAMPATAR